jgi:hypothetical protein
MWYAIPNSENGCVISRFRREVDEKYATVRYYATSIGPIAKTERFNVNVGKRFPIFPA